MGDKGNAIRKHYEHRIGPGKEDHRALDRGSR